VILEGIFALHDPRILDMLDLRIFCEADADLCLSRRSKYGGACLSSGHYLLILLVLRDVRERGRDMAGCIKQWFSFVKPNFHKFVEPQRLVAGQYSLSFLPQHSFYDDSTTSIVHLNTIEDKTASIFRSYLI